AKRGGTGGCGCGAGLGPAGSPALEGRLPGESAAVCGLDGPFGVGPPWWRTKAVATTSNPIAATEPRRTPWRTNPHENCRNAIQASVCLPRVACNPSQPDGVRAPMQKIRQLCVYCGSSGAVDRQYREAASELGARLAAAGVGVIFCGRPGGVVGLAPARATRGAAAGTRVSPLALP